MIVCHCHVVSDRDIHGAIDQGARDVCALAAVCGAGSECGGCLPALCELMEARGIAVDALLSSAV